MPSRRPDGGRLRRPSRPSWRGSPRLIHAGEHQRPSFWSVCTRNDFRYIGDFSTGMQQRVKLAQSIVHDPELVLLDEPASGLDPYGREQMLALISRLNEFEINVLFSSHILDDIEQTCQWVVMLDRGRVIRSSPLEPPASGDELSVEVFGSADALAAALEAQGVTVSRHSSILTVRSAEADVYDIVLAALVATSTPLRRMGASLMTLEDQFLAASEVRGE